MIFEHRQVAATILLAFVLGIAAVNVHAATHLSGEFIDCNLCSVYSDQPAASNDGILEQSPNAQALFSCEHPPKVTENEAVRRLFARGPP